MLYQPVEMENPRLASETMQLAVTKTHAFGYLSCLYRSLSAFCYKLFCRRRLIIAATTVGLVPCLLLRLRLKDRDPKPRSAPKREPAEDESNTTTDSDPYQVEPTDSLYCGYDNTWETSTDAQGVRRPIKSTHRVFDSKFSRFENAARDMFNYRNDYPLSTGRGFRMREGNDMPNLDFYLGKRPSVPDGFYIHEFHEDWRGQYAILEQSHGFIQWIFPLQETGMNYEAYELTKPEIEAFRNNETAKLNLLKSYTLILDFYGIELSNPESGEVKRALHWQERFQNLNCHTHNNLRLTRILKCLGTLGFVHYQAPLVRFFLEETLVHGHLPRVKESALNYFLFAVLDRDQRIELVRFAYLSYEPKEEFIWCPKKIQEVFLLEQRCSGLSHPV